MCADDKLYSKVIFNIFFGGQFLKCAWAWATIEPTTLVHFGSQPCSLPYWINTLPLRQTPERMAKILKILLFKMSAFAVGKL